MYDYRAVEPRDFKLICRHRYEMFKASGRADAILVPMSGPSRFGLNRVLLPVRILAGWLAPRVLRLAGWG